MQECEPEPRVGPQARSQVDRYSAVRAIALVCVFTCVLAAIGVYAVIRQDKIQAVRELSRDSRGQLAAVAEQTRSVVQGVDLLLTFSVQQAARYGAREALPQIPLRILTGALLQLTFVDPDGRVVTSSLGTGTGVDLSDRPHFRVHREGLVPPGSLYISGPLLGRISQSWSIQFTRRISGDDGSFLGVAVASFDPFYFFRYWGKLDPRSLDSYMLINTRGEILADSGSMASGAFKATNIEQSDFGKAVLAAQDGERDLVSPIDGRLRHYAFTTLKTSGLVVAVGLDPQTHLAENRRRELVYFLLLIGFVAVVAMFGSWLGRAAIRSAKMQEEAARAHQQLRDAIEAVSDGFALYDTSDRLALCNEKYREVYQATGPENIRTGMAFEEIVRLGLSRGQYPEAVGRESEWLAHRLQQHRNPGPAIEQPLPSGRWVRIEEKKTADGGIVGIRVDITPLKRREMELKAAKEQAESASRMKADFVANMSHEIRTPLNGVIGAAALIPMESLDTSGRLYLKTIRESADHLLALLNDVLDFSKLEAKQLVLEESEFSLRNCVNWACDAVRTDASAKDLTLVTEIDEHIADTAVGDVGRLRQILLNLMSNAVKFTERGSVTLAVDLLGSTSESMTLRFSVIDTGIGIDAATLPRLFGRFVQEDASTSRRYGGSGLGLAITHGLVELMGGAIHVESEKGSGSRFWFDLTLRRSDRQGQVAAPIKAAVTMPKLRILLAEDNVVNQIVLRGLLAAMGHDVQVAASGKEAVAAVRDGHFDVVLMDVQMPEMDGLEATRCIRQLSGDAGRIPIFALTANAAAEDAAACRAAGMDEYLAKPVRSEHLRALLLRRFGARAHSAA